MTINHSVHLSPRPPDGKLKAGFASLCKGVFSMFRNPTAHDPRLHRTVSDEELLDALTVISLIHRRLDRSVVQP